MKLYFSPKAQYQYQCLKGRSVPYAEQVKALLKDIQEHPLSGMGTPALVEPSIPGYWGRRFNGSGMLLYSYEEGEDFVVVISIINDLLPSHEELPVKLQAYSKQDYAAVIKLMEANRGHGNDPKVGIFWYNVAWKELFGVVSHPVRDYSKANASDGRITCSEMHEDVWRKEYNRQRYHGDGKGPFVGAYEKKPRGRIFYLPDEDRFEIAVGQWFDEYPEAKQLIMDEFDLPEEKTVVKYSIHWDIGHCWR